MKKEVRVFEQHEKGEAVSIIDGIYLGKCGWRWNGKSDTKCKTWVIIQGEDKQVGTAVNKENVVASSGDSPPSTTLEAALQFDPVIKARLKKTFKKLVQCNVPADQDLFNLILEMMNEAIQHQKSLGKRAVYYNVGPFDDANMHGDGH